VRTATAPVRASAFWRGLQDVPADWPACVVTVGVFDGVHRGHARLIGRARRLGRARQMPVVLVTFDPHPAQVLGLPRDTAALSTLERRADLAAQLGVDAVCVLPFTEALAQVSAEDFVEHILVQTLHACAVVVGANFTFGRAGAGDVATLHGLGQRYGYDTHAVGLLHADDAPYSSSHIRTCLRRGDVAAAGQALGRPHRVDGTLGATGDVTVPAGTALPAAGHYAGRVNGRLALLKVTAGGQLVMQSLRAGPGDRGALAVVEFLGHADAGLAGQP